MTTGITGAARARTPFAVTSTEASQKTQVVNIDFSSGAAGFKGGFADLPASGTTDYKLRAGAAQLPSELGAGKGFILSGFNHSDDLLMFATGQVKGLKAGVTYRVKITPTFATNSPAGGLGVGGSPEAVTVKVGLTTGEPKAAVDAATGYFKLNIDTGNQTNSGSDLHSIGNIASSKVKATNPKFVSKTIVGRPFDFKADGPTAYLTFATDSGFEGLSTLYLQKIKVELTPVR